MSAVLHWESTGEGRASVSGELTFATAAEAYAVGVRALETQPSARLRVDCSGVAAADSAGLAVMLGWMAVARSRSATLVFERLPEPMRGLARISEIEAFLES